ncbi:MAG: efflux RND transporter periplasmic adaptor subunit [Pseudomonadales bacterium]|nr:efflux RND transporter periplasmic adaptor subunit [Pseudomonadales bacterium]
MNKSIPATILALVITATVAHYVTKSTLTVSEVNGSGADVQRAEDKQPLYWVAPMDSGFRRDAPGKSPMGMDLVPVYEQDDEGSPSGYGTVSISPDVVNNLGVRTTLALLRPLQTEITTVGYVKYDEDQLVHIHPRVEGWIEKLHVKAAGDPIKKGEPLYSLYSPQLVNAQEELVLAFNRNNERLLKAAEDRLKALQVDDTVIGQLKRDRKVHQTVTFYAPQSGVVDNLNVREGFFVKPGTTLMSVGTLKDVWVEAEVFERQAALVAVDLPVTMNLDYLPGKTWQGTVDYVYPTLDPKTRTARVRLRFSNPESLLKPNMFAQVTIHAEVGRRGLTVPNEAVIRTGKQDRVVLALGEGRYRSVDVALGHLGNSYTEITEGIEEGSRVVVSAQFLLDSESSKNADFKRMNHSEESPESGAVMSEHHQHTAEMQ